MMPVPNAHRSSQAGCGFAAIQRCVRTGLGSAAVLASTRLADWSATAFSAGLLAAASAAGIEMLLQIAEHFTKKRRLNGSLPHAANVCMQNIHTLSLHSDSQTTIHRQMQ